MADGHARLTKNDVKYLTEIRDNWKTARELATSVGYAGTAIGGVATAGSSLCKRGLAKWDPNNGFIATHEGRVALKSYND